MQIKKDEYKKVFKWLVDEVNQLGVRTPKTIIYVQSVDRAALIYEWLVDSLHFLFSGAPSVDTRIVDMFHASIDDASVKRIVDRMTATDGSLRILVSTVAFGMGINCPDVRRIFHWGLPDTVTNYVQQIGRCGRDGYSGVALCYAYTRSISRNRDKAMQQAVEGKDCIKLVTLQPFAINEQLEQDISKMRKTKSPCDGKCTNVDVCECAMCMCCTVCAKKCKCVKAHCRVSNFIA